MANNNDTVDTTISYKYYLLDQEYKARTNLLKYTDEATKFYRGDQYPNANYNNMIRVTMNICKMSAVIKASKICGTPIYLTFTADNKETDCTALRQFDEYNCSKLKMKSSNYNSAIGGFVTGTEICYVAWDEDDTSYKGIYRGGLREEHIDIKNFACANYKIKNIQNQKWVMMWEDFEIGAIKELLEGTEEEKREKEALLTREVGDDITDTEKDEISHALIPVFVRFFRIDGEVYFTCETKTVEIFSFPHPLSRSLSKAVIKKVIKEYRQKVINGEEDENQSKILDYSIDFEDKILPALKLDKFTKNEYKQTKEKFSLYPFAVFRPYERNDCFWGISDIKELIPTQKGINFALSMNLKCAENNAYNKTWVKPDTLKGQKITNEPGQTLVDYSKFTNGWGYKMQESMPLPNGLSDFTSSLLSMARLVHGFNEVMDGSVTNKDMSGYMLQQMIKQANTSIEQQQQIFWEFNEDKAAIRLMYYKHYVDSAKYTYELDDATYQGEEQARQTLYNKLLRGEKLASAPDATIEDFENPVSKTKIREISNEDIYGINFDISIEAMQGLSDSKLVEQQMWDNLLLNGGIQNIDPEILSMYLQASPNVSQRTKNALKSVVDTLKNSKMKQLESKYLQLAQASQQLAQYAKYLEAKTGVQSEYLKNLNNEFSQKINTQNDIIGGLVKELDKTKKVDTTNGASEGEVKSNNAKGIGGTSVVPQN